MRSKATAAASPQGGLVLPLGEAVPTGPTSKEFGLAASTHQPDLMAKAMRLTRNEDEALDLVQDALFRAMQAMKKFQPGTNLRAWLMRIMVNVFIDRCRKRASRPLLVPLHEEMDLPSATDENDDEPLSASVTSEQLRSALDQLDPLFREAYEMRITRQLSYEAIAAELQIPIGTVGTRLLRARERLCRILTPAARGVDAGAGQGR